MNVNDFVVFIKFFLRFKIVFILFGISFLNR